MNGLIILILCFNLHVFDCQFHKVDNQRTTNNNDNDDIHLYVWNDLNNHDNYYPNIVRNIERFQSNDESATTANDVNSLLTLEKYPSSATSSMLPLKYAFQQALLYDQLGMNDRNQFQYPKKDLLTTTWNRAKSITTPKPKLLRPNLRQMYNDKRVQTIKYYTNLPLNSPKSDAIDYRNPIETISKQYSTFEMLEPIPQQVMLPPIFNRIPKFKPVPPRLDIIPVVSEYLEKYPNHVLSYYRPPLALPEPYSVINSTPKMIPFSIEDAVTRKPILKNSIEHFSNVPKKYVGNPLRLLEMPDNIAKQNDGMKLDDSSPSASILNIAHSKKRFKKHKSRGKYRKKQLIESNCNKTLANTIQLSDAYSRQTSNVNTSIALVFSQNQTTDPITTTEANQFLIALPDDDILQLDESTQSTKIDRSDHFTRDFNDTNGQISNITNEFYLNETTTFKSNEFIGESKNNASEVLTIEDKYRKWFEGYKEKNQKKGRPIFSEHFKTVKIAPNIDIVVVPR